uniref:Uncharacterized protein n=1 Tax=Rhizophora mucronata TaxID=61149 RepID=A0A2P2QPF6_RHIMU
MKPHNSSPDSSVFPLQMACSEKSSRSQQCQG